MTDAGAPPGPVEDALALVRDGQAKFASGEVEQARTAFAKALTLKPDDAGAKAGLERCERLLAERDEAPPDGLRTDDFPDSGENPEATIVDPNYLIGMGLRGPDAGGSGEFPEPLTVPLGAIEKSGETGSPASESPPPGEAAPASKLPDYPRYVATLPGNYPEVRAGGRPTTGSPPPSTATPLPGPMPMVAYPQMPPGGPSAYPQYATPVGGYIPTPPPMAFPITDRRRQMILLGAVGGGCLLLGLLLGWVIFGAADDDDRPAAGAVTPLVARDAGSTGADASAPKATAGTTTSIAHVTAIERPVLAAVTAPAAGQIDKLHARAAAHVKAGARLYTLKKAGTPDTVIEAPRAGRFEVRAAEGDKVAEGDILALLVDPDAWLLVADLTGDAIAPSWRCEVTSGDRVSRSPCVVQSVQPLGGGRVRATARVAARDAGWLKGDESDLSLGLTPP